MQTRIEMTNQPTLADLEARLVAMGEKPGAGGWEEPGRTSCWSVRTVGRWPTAAAVSLDWTHGILRINK